MKKTSSSSPTSGSARQRRGRTTVERVDKSRAEQIVAAAGDRRIEKRPRSRGTDPSRLLANYFLDEWEGLCQEVPRLREFRPADSVGQTVGYIRSTLLAPAAGRVYSPEEVRGYIDQFIDAVHRSTVQIKPNQSAFSRFTGMWGREDKMTYGKVDMDANRRFFEDSQKES